MSASHGSGAIQAAPPAANGPRDAEALLQRLDVLDHKLEQKLLRTDSTADSLDQQIATMDGQVDILLKRGDNIGLIQREEFLAYKQRVDSGMDMAQSTIDGVNNHWEVEATKLQTILDDTMKDHDGMIEHFHTLASGMNNLRREMHT